jgi:hypothetical protein
MRFSFVCQDDTVFGGAGNCFSGKGAIQGKLAESAKNP